MNRLVKIYPETIILDEILRTLESQTGFKAEWFPASERRQDIDGKISLTVNGTEIMLWGEIKSEVRSHQLDRIFELADRYQPLMVIAERIFPAIKEKLREKGIAYLDGAGNFFLNVDAKFIWVEGNRPIKGEKSIPNRAFTKMGLKVLYMLLAHPETVNAPYRDIAQGAGVALGNIPLVLAGLKESGYLLQVDKKKVVLQNKKELLDRWTVGFRETLKPGLHLGNYRLPDKVESWHDLKLPDGNVWGGEPAASRLDNYLNPEILTIYTQGHKNNLMKGWRLLPDMNGKVQIYQKFWRDQEDKNHLAPPLVIYADLMATDDPRCQEAAIMLYNNTLKPNFE